MFTSLFNHVYLLMHVSSCHFHFAVCATFYFLLVYLRELTPSVCFMPLIKTAVNILFSCWTFGFPNHIDWWIPNLSICKEDFLQLSAFICWCVSRLSWQCHCDHPGWWQCDSGVYHVRVWSVWERWWGDLYISSDTPGAVDYTLLVYLSNGTAKGEYRMCVCSWVDSV